VLVFGVPASAAAQRHRRASRGGMHGTMLGIGFRVRSGRRGIVGIGMIYNRLAVR
jgi:hypothetical protein